MKIMFNGTEVGRVCTNHSITLEDAIYTGLGIDINSQEDCKKLMRTELIMHTLMTPETIV